MNYLLFTKVPPGTGLLLLLISSLAFSCRPNSRAVDLVQQRSFRQSALVRQDTYRLPASEQALLVSGKDIHLDFQGAVLEGFSSADQLIGTALLIKEAQRVTIENLYISGYQWGIIARGVEQLVLRNVHIDLLSRDLTRGGAAIGLERCTDFTVEDNRISRARCGIHLINSMRGALLRNEVRGFTSEGLRVFNSQTLLIRENYIHHGTGPGILLEESYRADTLLHNRLQQLGGDPVVRGVDGSGLYVGGNIPALPLGKKLSVSGTVPPSTASFPLLLNDGNPYSGSYPRLWYRQRKGREDKYLITGPPGNWRLLSASGYNGVRPRTGTTPATILAQQDTSDAGRLQLEFIGQAYRDEQGRMRPKGQPLRLDVSTTQHEEQ